VDTASDVFLFHGSDAKMVASNFTYCVWAVGLI